MEQWRIAGSQWGLAKLGSGFLYHSMFSSSQNPREADAMTKVQAELDETKIILVWSRETGRTWVVSLGERYGWWQKQRQKDPWEP